MRTPINVNALSIALADSLWDQLDGDDDLPMTECGGWRKYDTDAALALPHVRMLICDAAEVLKPRRIRPSWKRSR